MFPKGVKIFLFGCMVSGLLAGSSLTADEVQDFAKEVASSRMLEQEEMNLIADQHLKMGEEYMTSGDYDQALSEFDTVLDLIPGHSEAKTLRLECIQAIANGGKMPSVVEEPIYEEPIRIAPPVMPREKSLAGEAYDRGLKAYRNGDWKGAINHFRAAIKEDPNYIPAKRFIKRILDLEKEQLDRDHDVLWSKRLNEVKKSWLPTGKVNKIADAKDEVDNIRSPQKEEMLQKVKQIIPEINFTQAHIRDVLQYLSKITGVNIILDERVFEGTVAPVYTGGPGGEDGSEEGEEYGSSGAVAVSDTITISLTNIPLIEALKYILKVKGLKFRIDEYAIMVSTPEGIGDEEMETRFYHLSSGVADFVEFKMNESGTDAGGIKAKGDFGGDGMEVEEVITIKDVLTRSGVPFPPGSSTFMDKRTGTLIVHNTPENLAMVEKLLKIIDKPPFQVNIQAKFVRIAQSDLEELGFEWMLNSSTRVGEAGTSTTQRQVVEWTNDNPATTEIDPGWIPTGEIEDVIFKENRMQINADTTTTSLKNAFNNATHEIAGEIVNNLGGFATSSSLLSLSGILTDPQFTVVMHALDKKGGADLLSAPSVTTVNNQQAQIELVEEIIYPTEYDVVPPTQSENGNSSTPGFAVPGDFVTRDVGVILNVTPSVGSDRRTITLTLIPEVSELDRWIDYGYTYYGSDGSISTYNLEQPVFKTNNVSTTVIVNDGETVVLGGLIEEKKRSVHDKVPFLGDLPFIGRLFRHDLEASEKMNLMIFVTAKLLSADGEDLHISSSDNENFYS